MAATAGTKRKWDGDLDFVPTISDSDSIPDLDAEQEALEEKSSVAPPTSSKSNKKRKKTAAEPVNGTNGVKAKSKSSKKKGRPPTPSSDEEGKDDTRWTSKGQVDGAFDPDFEFGDFGDDAVTDGFDGWALPGGGRSGEGVSESVGVEEIIRRRQALKEDGHGNAEVEGLVEVSGEEVQDYREDINGFDHGDDELLAEDAFGMGAPAENEDEDDDEDDEGDVASHSESEGSSAHVEAGEEGGHSEDDDEEEEIAFPMPEPDDLAIDDASDEENQDPAKLARRDAFFAPEDKATKPTNLAKTEASFQSMSLSRPILRGLTAVGFTTPTPIQSKTVPVALMGKDVVGGAVTGSGKTAAFILPILERLLYRPKKFPTTRVGILMPTRELAVQCYNVATKLAQYTDITFALLVGGLSLREQEQTLKKRPDIVIATPGRFIDHMRNSASFVVENLEILVLDEADRMLEDGFADELNEVLNTIPRSRQTMLFSATMTQDVDKLIRVGLNRPVRLMVDAKQQTVSSLVQEFIKLKGSSPPNPKQDGDENDNSDNNDHDNRRLATLLQLCLTIYTTQTIVFLPTKSLAHRVKVLFALNAIPAAELHGSMSQEQRLNAIGSFRDSRATHLLATDLASRGLDIPRVDTVINYTVPTSRESYLHRVGRTARAGRTGVAVTLFSGDKPAPSPSTTKKGKTATERTLLRPILRLAKSQAAPIRTRTLPLGALTNLQAQVSNSQPEIDAIFKEEKEERLLAQTERDMNKGENLMQYEAKIMSRPRRTWFQSESEKERAKGVGREARMGFVDGGGGGPSGGKKEKKGRLSGKEKKRLDARDERKGGAGAGWKKGADERVGGGVLKREIGKGKGKGTGKPKSKMKSRSAAGGGGSKKRNKTR